MTSTEDLTLFLPTILAASDIAAFDQLFIAWNALGAAAQERGELDSLHTRVDMALSALWVEMFGSDRHELYGEVIDVMSERGAGLRHALADIASGAGSTDDLVRSA